LNGVAPRLRAELLSQRIERAGETLRSLWRLAELAHPERPLKRGFARVTSRAGKTLAHRDEARAERRLTLHFGDGALDASVDGAESPPAPVERKPRRSYMPPQPGLFDRAEE
jgi:exodeoxyribonuclease VII large subunit